MTDLKKVAAAVSAALAVPLLLTGCVSTESFETAVPSALTASDDRIASAAAKATDGVSGVRLTVKIWVTTTDQSELAEVLDGALRTSIAAAPARPAGLTLFMAEAPGSSSGDIGYSEFDFAEAARESGVYDYYGNRSITGHIDRFEELYGSWEELHGEWREEQQ